MLLIRKFGKIIRGKATPVQIFMACLLGTMISFVPSFWQAPGLVAGLLMLLVVLNANLPLAALSGLVGRLVFLAATPVSFAAGRTLIHGPTEGLVGSMVNAPILAFFGLEYYLTLGSLVVGLGWGVLLGLFSVKVIVGFRRRAAALEEGSEAYKKWSSKWYVRFLTWVFFGKGKGKGQYDEILAKKIGNPIRILGVVAVIGGVLVAYVIGLFFSDEIVYAALKKGLQKVNGATVDIRSVEVELSEGRIVIHGLAMADPDQLDTDFLRAEKLEIDFGTKDLLRKRFRIDRVTIGEATSGEKRSTPGKRIEKEAPKEEEPPPPPGDVPDAKKLDEYLVNAEKWKDRLARVQHWLDRLSGPEAGEGEADGDAPDEAELSLGERLALQAAERGYAAVAARHLVEDAPTVVIAELNLEKLRMSFWKEEALSLSAMNLSSHPSLLDGAPQLATESEKKTFTAELILAGLSASAGESVLRATFGGLPVDSIADELSVQGTKPIQGGTMDLAFDGSWPGSSTDKIRIRLIATLHDTTITLQGQSAQVKKLEIPIEIIGPLTNPRVSVDAGALSDALLKAGADELARRVRAETDKLVDQGKEEAGKLVDKALEDAKKKLGDEVLKGADEKIGEDLKKKIGEQAGEDVKKATEGVFDWLGGKKKKK
ncbi:MAG: hypothetical protein O7H41_15525 [Planctomycetota bacterium]|nr:hypothetical protein [Planctomycetota bacterium]